MNLEEAIDLATLKEILIEKLNERNHGALASVINSSEFSSWSIEKTRDAKGNNTEYINFLLSYDTEANYKQLMNSNNRSLIIGLIRDSLRNDVKQHIIKNHMSIRYSTQSKRHGNNEKEEAVTPDEPKTNVQNETPKESKPVDLFNNESTSLSVNEQVNSLEKIWQNQPLRWFLYFFVWILYTFLCVALGVCIVNEYKFTNTMSFIYNKIFPSSFFGYLVSGFIFVSVNIIFLKFWYDRNHGESNRKAFRERMKDEILRKKNKS